MKTLLSCVLTLILLSSRLMAQPNIEWSKCLGGTGQEDGRFLQQTSDGGFIIGGKTKSNDGDASGNHGGGDIWLVKLNSAGTIAWQICLGGSEYEDLGSLEETSDGGFILTGRTGSNNGNVVGNHGSSDVWVVKLSSDGVIIWQRCYGGFGLDYGWFVKQTFDGGYVIAGASNSTDGNVSGNHGDFDCWVLKLNGQGNLVWQKSYGGSGGDSGYAILQSNDGGYVILGSTSSNNGDVSGNHGSNDIWVLKVTSQGELTWQKCLGGTNNEYGFSIAKTIDGGYIISGRTESNNGDVIGFHYAIDMWVVKLNSTGNLVWQNCLGGYGGEIGHSIKETLNGGYIVSGGANSLDGDVICNPLSYDFWLVGLNQFGNLEWQKCLGGEGFDASYSAIQSEDGGFVVVGTSQSFSGDVIGNHGNGDIWLVKLSPTITETSSLSIINDAEVLPNPSKGIFSLRTNPSMLGKGFNVFNSLGKIVTSGVNSTESTVINLDNQASGIYSIRFDGDKNRSLRIVKD